MEMGLLPVLVGIFGPGLMTFGLFIWQNLWKRDALELNAFKGCFASLFLGAVVLGTTSSFRKAYTLSAVLFMFVSSFLGIVVADTWWLISLRILGARKMIAVDVLKPFFALIIGSLLLRDSISSLCVAGVCVTTLGVFFVLAAPKKETTSANAGDQENSISMYRGALPVLSPVISGIGEDIESGPTPYLHNSRKESQINEETRNGLQGRGYFYALGNVLLDLYAAAIVIEYHGGLSVADVTF